MTTTAYRPQQITIDVIKPDTPPMISLLVQKLELGDDHQIVSMSSQDDRIYRNGLKILADHIAFTDPVTGLSGEVSIAGMQRLLATWANQWVAHDFDCEIDPTTGWSINCQNK
jgi:hypothetical protein